jgi:hypothetical protein
LERSTVSITIAPPGACSCCHCVFTGGRQSRSAAITASPASSLVKMVPRRPSELAPSTSVPPSLLASATSVSAISSGSASGTKASRWPGFW